MRCRSGVTETSFCDPETTASVAPLHPRNCVRRASGFVLTAYPQANIRKSSGRIADHSSTIRLTRLERGLFSEIPVPTKFVEVLANDGAQYRQQSLCCGLPTPRAEAGDV